MRITRRHGMKPVLRVALFCAAAFGFAFTNVVLAHSTVSLPDETADIAPEAIDMQALMTVDDDEPVRHLPADDAALGLNAPGDLAYNYVPAPPVVSARTSLANDSAYLVNSEIPLAVAFISIGGLLIVGLAIFMRDSYLRREE